MPKPFSLPVWLDTLAVEANAYRGEVAPGWQRLAQLFALLTAQQQGGIASGGALSVWHRGRMVIDIQAGLAVRDQLWQPDTLALSYSTGKGVLSTLLHRLADQGRLDYDQPVAYYWPEFAVNGKAALTVRQVLCHESGLDAIRGLIRDAHDMLDWQQMGQVMAQATPRFVPGQAVAYQAMTYGFILGHLLERVSGQPLAALLASELTSPLQITDEAYFGVPATALQRVARIGQRDGTNDADAGRSDAHDANDQPSAEAAKSVATGAAGKTAEQAVKKSQEKPQGEAGDRTQRNLRQGLQSLQQTILQRLGHQAQAMSQALYPPGVSRFNFQSDAALMACMPSFNGVFTSRALARHYAMLAQGGQDYLSTDTMAALTQVQNRQQDQVMPLPMHWRLGYHRVLTLGKRVPQGLGHIGYNGSGAWADPQRGLSFAYVHNRPVSSMQGDYRLWLLTQYALMQADAS